MDSGEQFSLCWNNFHSNLSSGFHNLLKDEDLVDVTLAAEGQFVKAHKTVLSVCSPFFKELFKVNPCKHPIVILPDVNYAALRSLLQFMYQGEVSVSQEEIPVFMKVAETLKVKGLTDNSETPNGFQSKPTFAPSISKSAARQTKKMVRPMHSLRPLESPKPAQSPQLNIQGPLAKRIHLDSGGTPPPTALKIDPSQQQNEALSLIKPKDEPLDCDTETGSQSCIDESSMDLANMLDTQLSGAPSPSHQLTPWPAPSDMNPVISSDESQPGSLRIIKSGKGQLVLIHNGHMYTFVEQRENRSLWICVKKKMLNCCGCLITAHGQLLSAIGHNHNQIHDVIQRLMVSKSTTFHPH
ncbi:broad-complex core protein isoforms 1/2/3/4/5-like isoform X3 [Anthonomus grandis grandis]|uniref:broad-complex core protein isoforms 1/2/3/4/5-like isoform X3 n=1 Tax=Anthonomus grandis grandis TaxID=2921223 RepID=UPI002165A1C9|nr:broad-complex core protein isoforms 1/2/3/4/5-like isoform X3 [Anthonomus grandis grandis]XP_050297282.1 broad-complex core protein isoforms 1/2/3/4/5-like isoform X3 [Anthonomus grandis grandis]XP_050297283.1 broad-complex core protein isoforms 1/2/3/4/5-like isoform X3 [Anthonomus grandis grandis]